MILIFPLQKKYRKSHIHIHFCNSNFLVIYSNKYDFQNIYLLSKIKHILVISESENTTIYYYNNYEFSTRTYRVVQKKIYDVI